MGGRAGMRGAMMMGRMGRRTGGVRWDIGEGGTDDCVAGGGEGFVARPSVRSFAGCVLSLRLVCPPSVFVFAVSRRLPLATRHIVLVRSPRVCCFRALFICVFLIIGPYWRAIRDFSCIFVCLFLPILLYSSYSSLALALRRSVTAPRSVLR